jgi:hypothetical protein
MHDCVLDYRLVDRVPRILCDGATVYGCRTRATYGTVLSKVGERTMVVM